MSKKVIIFGILIILILESIIPLTSALGVVPSSKKILVSQEESYQIKIQNNNKETFTAIIDIKGELSKYITISKKRIEFIPSKDSEIITISINVPADAGLTEGEHENYIIIKQQMSGSSQIEASLNIASRLNLMVPYSDQALEIELYTPNFEKGKTNNFVIETRNVGMLEVPGAIPIIEIYSSTNDKLEILQAQRIDLGQGEKILTDISWTPTLPNGKYYAKAFVMYGDKTATAEKIFNVGSPEIIIDSISTNSFKLGGIASLDLIISSTWIEPIKDVYADVNLMKDSQIVYSTKTINRDISSLGKTNLPIFLDTKGLEPRKYTLKINMHYLGLDKEETFDIFLDSQSIKISDFTGKITSADSMNENSNSGMTLLFIVISILVVLNGIVVYKFVIMKKKRE